MNFMTTKVWIICRKIQVPLQTRYYKQIINHASIFLAIHRKPDTEIWWLLIFKKKFDSLKVNSIFEILIFSFAFRQNFHSKKEASDLLYMLPSLDPALLSSHYFHLVGYGSCLRWFRVWSPIVSWLCDTLWNQIQKDFQISTFTTFLVQATVKKFHNQDWQQSTETKLIRSSPLWSGIMKPIMI
jgi:hypothetical protein